MKYNLSLQEMVFQNSQWGQFIAHSTARCIKAGLTIGHYCIIRHIQTHYLSIKPQTLLQQIIDQQRSKGCFIAPNFLAEVGVTQDLDDKAYLYGKIRTVFSAFGSQDLMERTKMFSFQAPDGTSGNYYIVYDRI